MLEKIKRFFKTFKEELYKLLIITLGNAVGGIGINMLFNIKYSIEQKEVLKTMKAKLFK